MLVNLSPGFAMHCSYMYVRGLVMHESVLIVLNFFFVFFVVFTDGAGSLLAVDIIPLVR